jgi:hypothetical protein
MTLSPTGVTEAAWGEDGKEAEDGEDHTDQEEDDPYQVRARRARWTPHTVRRGSTASPCFQRHLHTHGHSSSSLPLPKGE